MSQKGYCVTSDGIAYGGPVPVNAVKNSASHNSAPQHNPIVFRTDLGMYEQKVGHKWRYSVWVRGSVVEQVLTNRRRRWSAKVFDGNSDKHWKRHEEATKWMMGVDEFYSGDCKGNRWLIPINRHPNKELQEVIDGMKKRDAEKRMTL